MGKMRLKVLTVPALDPVTYQKHTAFCVVNHAEGQLLHAPGWTIQDAIELYCDWYQVDRDQIILERPFLPQRIGGNDEYRQ